MYEVSLFIDIYLKYLTASVLFVLDHIGFIYFFNRNNKFIYETHEQKATNRPSANPSALTIGVQGLYALASFQVPLLLLLDHGINTKACFLSKGFCLVTEIVTEAPFPSTVSRKLETSTVLALSSCTIFACDL